MLQEPAANCQAWIASLHGTGVPAALTKKSLMVYSASREEAERALNTLLRATQPDQPPVLPNMITWRAAPQEQQPIGLARPGVQGVLG